MDFEQFLESNIIEFLNNKVEKRETVTVTREEDYGLYLSKDYTKELKVALENDNLTRAKALFDELKGIYNTYNQPFGKRKIYAILEDMYTQITAYVQSRHLHTSGMSGASTMPLAQTMATQAGLGMGPVQSPIMIENAVINIHDGKRETIALAPKGGVVIETSGTKKSTAPAITITPAPTIDKKDEHNKEVTTKRHTNKNSATDTTQHTIPQPELISTISRAYSTEQVSKTDKPNTNKITLSSNPGVTPTKQLGGQEKQASSLKKEHITRVQKDVHNDQEMPSPVQLTRIPKSKPQEILKPQSTISPAVPIPKLVSTPVSEKQLRPTITKELFSIKYAEGLRAMYVHEYSTARKIFEELAVYDPANRAVRIRLAQCTEEQ